MDPTIKDIAKRVNVSFATVSRALNDKDGVKAETKRKILEEARRLNYRPNAIARGLVNRRTHTIGLIIPDITNPFFPEVARGVEDAAQAAGYGVFLCNTNWDRKKELKYLDLLSEKRVDGIIHAPISKGATGFDKILGDLPVVYVGRSPKPSEVSFVSIDNFRGGFLATDYLLEKGCWPVGFIGAPEDSMTLEERLKGYKTALKYRGREVDDRYIRFGDFKRETGYNIIKSMIQEGLEPKGIFGENDLLAIGAIQGAKELGLSVPEDLAVVGFDDIPMAAFPEISLTTIGQPKYEMGRLAFEMLSDKLENNGKAPAEAARIILEPHIIPRKSA